jgi:hypothetical protein
MKPDNRDLNLKKTLWKLAYAKRAVFHVLTTCDFYLQHVRDDDHPMHIPLVCSICVMYARPFTDNEGVGMISAKFARYSDTKLQKTHDLLWESRKRFYAHTDATLKATSASGVTAPLQQIQVTVSRQRTPTSELFSFGYTLPEMRLRGIVIPDIRALCHEFTQRLDAEICSTMDQLFSSKIPELKHLLDEAHTDNIAFPLDLDPIA